MKKITLIVLASMLICFFALPLLASSAEVTVSSVTASPGETVTLTVDVTSIPGVKAGAVTVVFDEGGLTLQDAKWNVPKALIADFKVSNKQGVFAFSAPKEIMGTVLTLTWKVKENPSASTYPVRCELLLKDADNNVIPCIYKEGAVKIHNIHTHAFTEEKATPEFLKSPATCTESAVYYKSCSCGARGTETFTSGSPLGHSYKTEWSTDRKFHWHECAVCGAKTDLSEHISAGEATEHHAKTCAICGYVMEPAKSHVHQMQFMPAKAATCTQNGNTPYYTCLDCGGVFADADGEKALDLQSTVIPATGHRESDWIVDREPQPGFNGSRHKECTVCHEILLSEILPALPIQTSETTSSVQTSATTAPPVTGSETEIVDTQTEMTESLETTATSTESQSRQQASSKNTVGIVLIVCTCVVIVAIPLVFLIHHKKKK